LTLCTGNHPQVSGHSLLFSVCVFESDYSNLITPDNASMPMITKHKPEAT
jgi:hypothetical protein